MGRPATIRDVAAQAGLSIATVSRVLTGNGAVSADSAARVRNAIDALGFRPNAIGRSLKAARSRTIGVLVPSLSNPIFAESVGGVQDAAAERGYSVLVATTEYDADRESRAIDALLSDRVEGLVLTVADGDRSATLDTLERTGTPFILAYNEPSDRGRRFVSVDNAAAAGAVAERMLRLGHRKVAMIAGRFRQSDRSRLRHSGFRAMLEGHGASDPELLEVEFSELRLAAPLADLLAHPEPPTALFASNDLLALATVRALLDLGLRVPDDVSVAGFDGIAVGELCAPRLTTIIQPARAMGRRAAELLLDSGDPGSDRIYLPFALRPGESLGPRPDAVPLHSPTEDRIPC
ncbi:LacI family transcriptional regulator [Allostella sp. ATCC 35155]|nr:LacI family transcriptional regulator [Stella sp. ATCC 35155]